MAESKVKRENYITVQGFMLTDFNLKGNELLIYACIYGFSQAENQSFSGGLQYLADWTNSTKQGVMKCLKSLEEKGYIDKRVNFINGVKFCEYRATKVNTPLKKVEGGMQQSLTGGGKQSLPNNTGFNKTTNNTKERKKGYDALIEEMVEESVRQSVYEFIKMRQLIKKPMTDYALKRMLTKLNTLSSDPTTQEKILEKSIVNNWQDIYALKEDAPQKKKADGAEYADLV